MDVWLSNLSVIMDKYVARIDMIKYAFFNHCKYGAKIGTW